MDQRAYTHYLNSLVQDQGARREIMAIAYNNGVEFGPATHMYAQQQQQKLLALQGQSQQSPAMPGLFAPQLAPQGSSQYAPQMPQNFNQQQVRGPQIARHAQTHCLFSALGYAPSLRFPTPSPARWRRRFSSDR
jgi:hypothetical protein